MEDYSKEILADYLGADFNKRLHIFLQYPRLRPEFLLIDQEEYKDEKTQGRYLHKRPFGFQLNVAFGLLTSGVKKLLGFDSV